MKKELFIFLFVSCFLTFLNSQSAPVAEPVYGGYIQDYDAIETSITTTRVFISTLSANSMFYADIDHSTPSSPSFGSFQTVPDLDADDGYGTGIRCFAADEGSGYVFAGVSSGELLGTDTTSGSIYTVTSNMIEDVEIKDSYIFWIEYAGSNVELYFGTISSAGVVSITGSTTITTSGYSGSERPEIMINPANDLIYIFEDGTPPTIYKASDTYNTISTSTTFSTLTVSDLNVTGKDYFAAGISPTGRIFVGGNVQLPTQDSYVGYSDDDGTNWTTFSLSVETGWGNRFTFADTSPNYHVFFGRAVSSSNGVSGSWSNMSSTGTPVMDSPHCADPVNSDFVYLRTDWGLGYYDCDAASASEWNDGITAVQVDDFGMDSTKEYAWVASKSGVWYVEDYTTSPSWISQPLWPGDDSTPYRSIATTSTADPVYAGSQSAVWKYDSSYGALTSSNFVQALNINSLGLTPGVYASCIAIDEYSSTERIYVGIYDFEDHDETTEDRGNLYQVDYNGSLWSNTAITGGDIPAYGIDPNDVVVVQESGNTVLYVGVDYHDYLSYDIANGVYRCEDSGGSWTNTFDFIEDGTGIHINASIEDLYVTDSDIIYACGTDENGTAVRCYYKAVGDTYWTVVSNTGLPAPAVGKAIAYDEVNQDLYIAVNSSIYVRYYGDTFWTPFYDYPDGTSIEFIYYDDLLVGTDYGLFGHEAEDGPLPVMLSSFSAIFSEELVTLYWTTEHEENNSGWNIYRGLSENAMQNNAVIKINSDFIAGAGNTDQITEYEFIDPHSVTEGEKYWYWLEDIAYDGTNTIHSPTSIEVPFGEAPQIPENYGLYQNFPNPFNPNTTIKFTLDHDSFARLVIYNVKGEKVITLFEEETKGDVANSVEWTGKDHNGDNVSSGIYFYQLQTAKEKITKRMILLKQCE